MGYFQIPLWLKKDIQITYTRRAKLWLCTSGIIGVILYVVGYIVSATFPNNPGPGDPIDSVIVLMGVMAMIFTGAIPIYMARMQYRAEVQANQEWMNEHGMDT